MKLEKISLLDYRNIKSEEIFFGDKLNIISGPNGHGKTNILESIYLCSTGRS
ncbi:MAG: AAA family ATPase, partial [Firmicutes bacterium]|nr:AAA family ATPase [Bacillota bacterium]